MPRDQDYSAVDELRRVAKAHGIDDLTEFRLAEILNQKDHLAHLRNEFFYPKMRSLPHADQELVDPDDDCIYFSGNSLGLQPKSVRRYIDLQLDKWAKMAVFGHEEEPLPWILCDEYVVEGFSKIVGARDGEVVLMNSLTVNVHVMLSAFYQPTAERHKILLESKAFPSDHYAVESQIKLKGLNPEDSMVCLQPRPDECCLRTEDIVAYLEREGRSVAVVFFSGVQYYTGQLFDMKTITEAAKKQGCIVGWNLAHAVGNVPLELHDWKVDFACWCSYKYMSSSAGGMAGTFLHDTYKHSDMPRLLGWWSHKTQSRFLMDNKLELSEGAFGFRISNPPPLLVCPLQAILEIFAKTSMGELREKSVLLTGYMEYLLDTFFGEHSPERTTDAYMRILTPRNAEQRGCQLSLKFSTDIAKVYQELLKRGVACDKRLPDVIRIAPLHLYNNFTDCRRFVDVLQQALIAAQ